MDQYCDDRPWIKDYKRERASVASERESALRASLYSEGPALGLLKVKSRLKYGRQLYGYQYRLNWKDDGRSKIRGLQPADLGSEIGRHGTVHPRVPVLEKQASPPLGSAADLG